MLWLRQSTGSQAIKLGPFVDDTDGKTAETGLTIANTDIKLSKNGAAFGSKNSGGGTHDVSGWYTATLDSTDTNTIGTLDIEVAVSGALPVFKQFMILPANTYDSLVNGTDYLQTDVTQFGGTNGTFASGVPAVNTTQIGGTSQTGRDIGASVLLSSGTGTGQISLASGLVTVGTNNDKTGYALTQVFPTNFEHTSINPAGEVVTQQMSTVVSGVSAIATIVGSTGVVVGSSSIASMADAVWDEPRSGHSTSGTYGQFTGDAAMRGTDSAYTGTPPTAGAIADAVWDETQTTHTTTGTFGKYLDTQVSTISGGGGSLTEANIDEIVSRVRGVTVRGDVPAASRKGFSHPFIAGDVYTGDRKVAITITGWQGQAIADADSITLTADLASNAATTFSWTADPADAVTSGTTVTIYFDLAANDTDQTAGIYLCQCKVVWGTEVVTVLAPTAQLEILASLD